MVTGCGKVIWRLKNAFGKDTTLEIWEYHVPTSDVVVFVLQSYFQMDNKHGKMSVDDIFCGDIWTQKDSTSLHPLSPGQQYPYVI